MWRLGDAMKSLGNSQIQAELKHIIDEADPDNSRTIDFPAELPLMAREQSGEGADRRNH
jgi:Ca2+-binding EF-hand superfamily protein